MSSRVPDSIETRREHQIRSMVNEAESLRALKDQRFGRQNCSDREVHRDDFIVFLKSLLKWTGENKGSSWLAGCLIKKVQPANAEPLGRGGTRWGAAQLARWLRFETVAVATEDGAQRILDQLALFVGDKLKLAEPDAIWRALQRPYASRDDAAAALVALVSESLIPEWLSPFGYVSWVDASFSTNPASFDEAALNGIARQVTGHLADIDGPRVAVIRGGPHSGKKVVLRHIIAALPKSGGMFRLANGVLVPVLALALDDHDPRSFVDAVYRFFASARYRRDEVERRVAMFEQGDKISRIGAMARGVPACVVLADIAGIEEDEVVRSMAGSPVGEVISALLAGHRFTRVAFTTTNRSDLGGAALEASVRCDHMKEFDVPGLLSLPDVLRALGNEVEPCDVGQEVGGLTARLAQMALGFRKDSAGAERDRHVAVCIAALRRDDAYHLVEFICRRLLTADEFFLAGLIASSHDGLRASVLDRILPEMHRLEGHPGPFRMQWRELIRRCEDLIQVRTSTGDPQLGDNPGEVTAEELFAVDDGWRRHVLKLWFEQDRVRARMAHWLIAREATDQARILRHSRSQGRLDVSFGRDVQALNALVAAIDTTEILSTLAGQGLATPPAGSPYLVYAEAEHLPPLRRRRAKPSSAAMLRYCYLQLYLNDLDGADFGLLSRKQDAATRLGILLRLFAPEVPWQRVKDRQLSHELRDYGHLIITFSPEEFMEILVATAISALRLERYDIVAAAARLGERFFIDRAGAGLSTLSYARLLRAEVDAGLLLGGNPDRFPLVEAPEHSQDNVSGLEPDTDLLDVAARLKSLLDGPFAVRVGEAASNDHAKARGKLLCKLGETYHVAGRFHHARLCFDEAVAMERALLADQRTRSIAPVFGGKGARSYLRFMLDRARTIRRKGRYLTFIFIDELALPAPQLILASEDVERAEGIMAMSSRRVSRERIVDVIGLQIDAARLAALQHDFARAYGALEAALSARVLSGSSLEVLLELNAIRTRFLIDGAILCLQGNAKNFPLEGIRTEFESKQQIEQIAIHLGMPHKAADLDISGRLLKQAEDSLSMFTKLLESRRVKPATYAIDRDYLAILIAGVKSRFVDTRDVPAILARMQLSLDAVIDAMRRTEYRMHMWEATRLRRGIRAALGHYG